MMEIKPWFSNFMAHSYLKEINNKKLEKYCLELKRTTKGRSISNYLGWQSYDLSLETPALAPLLQAIRKEIPFFENLLSFVSLCGKQPQYLLELLLTISF